MGVCVCGCGFPCLLFPPVWLKTMFEQTIIGTHKLSNFTDSSCYNGTSPVIFFCVCVCVNVPFIMTFCLSTNTSVFSLNLWPSFSYLSSDSKAWELGSVYLQQHRGWTSNASETFTCSWFSPAHISCWSHLAVNPPGAPFTSPPSCHSDT